MIGANKIDQQKCVIQLSGHSPRCLICEEFVHIGKNFPKNNLICATCNKKGHTVCSFAKSVEKVNETNEDELNLESHEFDSNTNEQESSTGAESSSLPESSQMKNIPSSLQFDLSEMDTNQNENKPQNKEEVDDSTSINLNINSAFEQSLFETNKQENLLNNKKFEIEETIYSINQELVKNGENFSRINTLFNEKEIEVKALRSQKAENRVITKANNEKKNMNMKLVK